MIAAVRTQLPKALQPIVLFAYVSGWRVQTEILPLEWRHVGRQKGEVRLDPGTTKNQQGRPIHRHATGIVRHTVDRARGVDDTSEANLREGVDRLNDHGAGTRRGDNSTASQKQTA
jgi:hypothetical protein